MRGSPLLRALFAFLVIASFGYPLWNLTREEERAAPVPQLATPAREVRLQLTFSAPPERVTLRHLGEPVWSVEKPGARLEKSASIEYPAEGVDLQFQISWPPGIEHAALRVQLTDPDQVEHDKTVWGGGEMDEVITFP